MGTEHRLVREAQIQALPSRQVQINGEIVTVKWDEENQTIYLMNTDGSWTGRSSKYELPPQPDEAAQPMPDEGDNNDVPAPEIDIFADSDGEETEDKTEPEDIATFLGIDEEEAPKPKLGKSPNKIIILGIVGVVAAAILVGCIAFASQLGASKTPYIPPTQPTIMTDEPIQTTAPVESTTAPHEATIVTEPTENDTAIYALRTNVELYPGDTLEESVFSSFAIPDAEYQLLSSLHGIYTDADIDHILGMKIQKYVPAGKYLAYEDLSKDFAPNNPWVTVSTGKVILPITLDVKDFEKLLWGNEVRIEIEVKSQHTAPAGTENTDGETTPTNPDGIDHNSSVVQSTVIDHYVIDQAVIVDLCDGENKSLYEQYWALALVPEIYQMDAVQKMFPSKEEAEQLIPVHIILEVTQEQQNVIEGILASKYESITINIPDYVVHCENESQTKAYEKLRLAMVAVMDHFTMLSAAEDAT